MEGPEIGIVETRNIVQILKEKYSLDFSTHALTSLKRRLERCIVLNNLKSADNLLSKLSSNDAFLDKFLMDIAIESTEMFRDPSLWRWLRDEFFPKQIKPGINFPIWIPECISGDELFTLCIVLNEIGYTDNVRIIATASHQGHIERIQSGEIRFKKVETSNENYKRYHGIRDFDSYYTLVNNAAIRDVSLISRVEFRTYNLISDPPLKDIKLIIFRNRLIYYNPGLQSKVMGSLYSSLSYNGHLVTGVMENMKNAVKNNQFVAVNLNENVFKKKM